MSPSRRGKKSFGTDRENTVSAHRQGRFCMAPHDIPRHFARCRMIANVRMKRSRTRFRVPFFCVPKDKPIHWRYVLQRTAGFEPAITVKRGVEPHRTGRGLSPLSTRLPCASTPGIRFGRASRTAVVSFTRAVGVLQVYFTILWGWIHGKKAANSAARTVFSNFSHDFPPHGNPLAV